MAEPCYPCSGFLSGCGWRDWHNDFRKDCFYYAEDKDMGATIPWCTAKKNIFDPPQCNGCQDFISKAEVRDIVSHVLEKRRDVTMADHLRDATKKMNFISREAAKQTLTALLIETALNNTGFKTDASKVYEDIAKNRLDTWLTLVPVVADLRPAVLCKDCRDYDHTGYETPEFGYCRCLNREVQDCFYCAHGEKGENQ